MKGFFSILTMLLLLSSFSSCLNKTKQTQPNVVFILVDDLGWTDVACNGSDFYQTPNVDGLANDGIRFTNAYAACTVCSPTRAAIMTAKYPARINCTDWIEGHKNPKAKLKVPDWTMYMDQSEYTMAEAFRDAGYKTAHIGKWHLGEDSIFWPENHGFDINIGGWAKGAPQKRPKKGLNGYFAPYGNPRLKEKEDDEYLTERLADEAVNYINNHKEEPFFLNLWLYNVHKPLQARQEKIDKYMALVDSTKRQQNPVYAAMVEHMDDAVGQIVNALKANGLYENTIIVFTSDNGGLIGQRNKVTSNYPLKNGKGHMYEGAVRVPAIIVDPSQSNKGIVSQVPIISMDYYPTLAKMAGIKVSDSITENWDGRDISNAIEGKTSLSDGVLFWHYPHYHTEGAKPYSAVLKDNWKLIRFFETETYELYNLEDDISESINRLEDREDIYAELKAELFAWYKEVGAQMPSPNPNAKN